MKDAFRWTRDFYACFGIATALLMFRDGGWDNANTWIGFLIMGVMYVIVRSLYIFIKEKVCEKIDGKRAERRSYERSDSHTGSWWDSSD